MHLQSDSLVLIILSKEVTGMDKQLFDIGSGKYFFDKKTLDSFIEEAKNRTPYREICDTGLMHADDGVAEPNEMEMQTIFEEVMLLYQDYLQVQSVDLLLRLKCRLEEFSIRYQSHVLAEEVIHINSCLPYENRMHWVKKHR